MRLTKSKFGTNPIARLRQQVSLCVVHCIEGRDAAWHQNERLPILHVNKDTDKVHGYSFFFKSLADFCVCVRLSLSLSLCVCVSVCIWLCVCLDHNSFFFIHSAPLFICAASSSEQRKQR